MSDKDQNQTPGQVPEQSAERAEQEAPRSEKPSAAPEAPKDQKQNRGKKTASPITRMLGNRKLRYGGLSVALTLIVIAVTVLANIAVNAVEDKWNLRLDMTRNKMYSLTDTTIDVLKDLDSDILITTLYRPGNENTLVTEMLAKYAARSGHVTVQNIDPIRNPGYTKRYASDETVSISEGSVIVSTPDEKKFRVLSSYQFYETQMNEQTFETTVTGYNGEQVLTNAIVYIAAENTPTIYYLQGHLERASSSFSAMQTSLESYNYSVKSLNMLTDDFELKTKDVLVVASPRSDISDTERDQIKDFLMIGGRMVYFADANADVLPNFESLFELFGVRFNHDLVVERAASRYYYDPTYIAPVLSSSHAISSPLVTNRATAILANCMSFTLPELQRNNVVIEPFLTTSSEAFGRVDVTSDSLEPIDSDLQGPLTVGVAITNKDFNNSEYNAQRVLFGTSTFVTDLGSYFSGNRLMYLSSVAWMSDRSESVYIRAKSLAEPSLEITSNAQMIWLIAIVVFILPGIVLAAAITVYLRRRHL